MKSSIVALLATISLVSIEGHGLVGQGNILFPRFTETHEHYHPESASGPSARFRLPNQVVPTHYKLQIRPILKEDDPNNFTAPGNVQITIECREATNQVVLHASELDIDADSVKIWPTNNPTQLLTIVSQTNDTSEGMAPELLVESYTIQTQEMLTVGESYELYIEYVAIVADPNVRMNGVYRSSYLTETNQTRYLATTQFSRTRAFRKTLPSFDEPSAKATFQITIGREDGFHSLSNMNMINTTEIPSLPGWHWDAYFTTPIMPPTIIAFIVSDFVNETANLELFHPDKPVSIWGPPPEMKEGGAVFAADAAARTLKHFEDYFGIEYELPKIDSAAIPDFAAGAMENWGLNTYRTIYLIWREGINTVAEKFRVANIIGHELAHQYWGNLVTHAWWNDWWLTGFASYYEYESVDAIHPEFEAINRLITSDVQPALEFDAGPSSRPIHGPNDTHFIENPSTINYNKGAALVNMMRAFITEQHFREACKFYLIQRSHQAVSQDVLFTDLNTYLSTNNQMPSNNKTVNEIMETWTLQTSFPLIKVSKAGPSHIYVSQEIFQNIAMKNIQQQNGLWHVPIFYISAEDPSFDRDMNPPKFWLDKNQLVMSHAFNTSQWILVNPDGQGYYRVLYDQELATLLKAQLSTLETLESIPIGSRSMIVDDYFAAAYNYYIPLEEALDMTKFIANETNFNVWVPYMKHLRKAYQLFPNNPTEFDSLKTRILQEMETAFKVIRYEQLPGEPPMHTIMRVQLFDWACPMADPQCVAEAHRLLDLWKNDDTINPIPVDIRAYIYCASVIDSTNGNWDFLISQYDSNMDSTLLPNAVICNSDSVQLESLLAKVLNEPIPSSDVLAIISALAINPISRSAVIDSLDSPDWYTLISKLGASGIATVISSISTHTRDTATHDRLRTIADLHAVELEVEDIEAMSRINSALAGIATNMEWFDNFGQTILTRLTVK